MDQPGNNHLLLRANRVAHPGGATSDRMRELLIRTAAERVADERFAADALEALRRRLDLLERQVHDLIQARESDGSGMAPQPGQSLAGIAATLDGLAATLVTMDGRLSSADARVSALDNRLERLDERLDDQYDRVTSLDGRLGAADGKIDALAGQFEDARADISDRLGALEETLFTLAEVLLRPAVRHSHSLENGYSPANGTLP
jgi:chromosome segregation ATPase